MAIKFVDNFSIVGHTILLNQKSYSARRYCARQSVQRSQVKGWELRKNR